MIYIYIHIILYTVYAFVRSLLLTLKALPIISSFNATSMSSEDFQDLARMQIPQQQASSHGAQQDFACCGERYM